MTDEQIGADLAAVMTPPPAAPPAERVAALRAQAEQRRGTTPSDATPSDGSDGSAASVDAPPRSRLLLGLAAGVVLLAAAGVVGAVVTIGDDADGQDLLARGTPEFAAVLADDGVTVDLDGSRAPEGRIVVVASTTLPVLPGGEYYELWFVGPDDSPGSPDRISAGTFHPDYDDGSTLVVLHAAVDPTLFPGVEITAETADGDPAPSGDVVIDGTVDLLGDR